jgi:hypothetical protein
VVVVVVVAVNIFIFVGARSIETGHGCYKNLILRLSLDIPKHSLPPGVKILLLNLERTHAGLGKAKEI